MEQIDYFKHRPLLVGFKFDDVDYVYDSKMNRILELDHKTYEELSIEKPISFNIDDVQSFLSSGAFSKVVSNENEVSKFVDIYFDNVLPRKFILEVTEDCNLRCKYCFNTIENGPRKHSKTMMDFQIAQKAIDQYFKIFTETFRKVPEEKREALLKIVVPNLSWWGGEPFLNFKLIKETCNYFKSLHWENYGIPLNKLVFSVVTNFTYLTKEIEEFILENDLYLMISLDGNEREHNNNRIFKDGRGTFDIVIKNISHFLSLYPDFSSKRIIIQAVYTEGCDLLSNNSNFFNKYFYYNNGKSKVLKISQYPQKTSNNFVSQYWINSMPKLADKINNFNKKILEIENIEECKLKSYFSTNENIFEELKEALLIEDQLSSKIIFNGNYNLSKIFSCPIGRDVIYVSAKGEYHICNKTDSSYPIGDVNKGINKEHVKSLLYSYLSSLKNRCKSCYAIHFCKMCPANLLNNNTAVRRNFTTA